MHVMMYSLVSWVVRFRRVTSPRQISSALGSGTPDALVLALLPGPDSGLTARGDREVPWAI